MLVLTRKTEQTILIGRDVIVTILRIKGRTVKIGIQAPSGTEVLRGELLDKQPQPKEPASESPASGAGPRARQGSPDLAERSTAGVPPRARRASPDPAGLHLEVASPATALGAGLPTSPSARMTVSLVA